MSDKRCVGAEAGKRKFLKYFVMKNWLDKKEASELTDELTEAIGIQNVIVEDFAATDVLCKGILRTQDQQRYKRSIQLYARMNEKINELFDDEFVPFTDWFLKTYGNHTEYHQDELFYSVEDNAVFTFWILLDRSHLSRSAGLDLTSYEKNEWLYEKALRLLTRRAVIVNGVVTEYNTGDYKRRFEFTRWLRRRETPRLKRFDLEGQVHIERYSELEPGDAVLFNSGLFHSSSCPEIVEKSNHKVYMKVHYVRKNARFNGNSDMFWQNKANLGLQAGCGDTFSTLTIPNGEPLILRPKPKQMSYKPLEHSRTSVSGPPGTFAITERG